MTKPRSPATIENALARIIGQIGAEAMAAATTDYLRRPISARTIHNWSDPDTPERCPAEAVIPLDRAFQAGGGEGAPLYETIGILAEADRAERFSDAAALATRAIAVIKEGGEAHAALVRASQPGATEADRRAAAREVEEAAAELTRTLPLLTKGTGHQGTVGEGLSRGGQS